MALAKHGNLLIYKSCPIVFSIYFTFVLLSDIKRLIQEMQLVSDTYVMKYVEKYWGVLASLDGRQGSVWLFSHLVACLNDEGLHFALGAGKLHKSAVTTCTFCKAVQNSIDC